MTTTVAAAAQREQLLDLANAISRDAENIETTVHAHSRTDTVTPEAVLALVYELRAHRITIAAAIAPYEPPRDSKPEVEEGWYEVELMGHRQRWAYLRCVVFAGRQLVEISTPAYPKEPPQHAGDDEPVMAAALVEYYSPAAIFSLSPSTEADVIRELQERSYRPF